MEERKGFVLSLAEAVPASGGGEVKVLDEKGQIKMVRNEGKGNPNLQVYPLLRPASVVARAGKERSKNQWVTLEKIKPGGIMEEHYNEHGAGVPIFDIALYVISGRLRVNLGDIEKTVGSDTLIYIPSNVKRSVTNVGKGIAKYLAMKVVPSGKGEKMGETVYTKIPKWCQTEKR
jgi:quercetin dioxygenase-like cupin family protein